MMNSLLTDEDSRRVADALIEKIEESNLNLAGAVYDAFRDTLFPRTKDCWKEDWFPLTFEQMANKIERGIISAAYVAVEKLRE